MKTRKLTALLLALCMLLSLSISAFAADDVVASGTIQDSKITWELDGKGWLTISGSGEAPVFTSADDQPWTSVREQIIRIGETLIEKGRESGSIRNEITVEDFYIALVGIPLQYLATRFRFDFGPHDCNLDAETRKITELSMCAIK